MGQVSIGGELVGVTSERLHVNAGTVVVSSVVGGIAGTVSSPAYSTMSTGELIAGTVAAICGTVTAKYVMFKARSTNTGIVYLGGSGVTVADGTADTTTGWPLSAGEETGWLPVDNVNRFYTIASAAAQGVIYMVVNG